MQIARKVLTPDALELLQAVAASGSFAAAARELRLVPSAVTYRVRQIEDALDVLLFDRSSRQARLTEAGAELLREGARLLAEIDAVANRVRRVATGWEPQFTIAADSVISRATLMELAQAFFALAPPTRLRIRHETLSGTLEALTSGQADLALGVSLDAGNAAGIHGKPLGGLSFVFAVAPHHPLANAPMVVLAAFSASNHGTSATKPSGQAMPPRAYRPSRAALARMAASVRQRDGDGCCGVMRSPVLG